MSRAPGVCRGARASVARAQRTGRARVLIVSGVAGEPQYADVFFKQATTMIDALKTRFGVPDSDIVYLAENPARDAARIKAASTKENVERELTALGARSKTGDVLFVMLIGHGSGDDQATSKFNVPGPDITAADFARMLDPVGGPIIAIVNAASASGGFIATLSGPNRVIATATKSDMEKQPDALRDLLRAGVRERRGRCGQGRPRLGARGVRVRAARSRARLREREPHAHGARAARRQRRSQRNGARPTRSPRMARWLGACFSADAAGVSTAAARGASSDPRVAALEREKDCDRNEHRFAAPPQDGHGLDRLRARRSRISWCSSPRRTRRSVM